jgi:hypothetical protein
VVFSRLAPARSGPVLQAQRTWLMANNRILLSVVLGVLGASLVVKGAVALLG